MDPLSTALCIRQIGDRAADAEVIADMMRPQLAIEGGSALKEPESPSVEPRIIPTESQRTTAWPPG
jgi:hypothetical protein